MDDLEYVIGMQPARGCGRAIPEDHPVVLDDDRPRLDSQSLQQLGNTQP